ncbi:MAG: YkuS family protein [Veillonellaceae bacterium]|nr:YkuS family protein [Veillonellaceae bacterium]
MQGLIAVEKNLSNLFEALETSGYEVVPLDNADMDTVDAIVLSGLDINLMNMQDVVTNVPVINASGKTPTDILEELEKL